MERQNGFSLIELLIVVAIIGILAAISVPALRRARESAQAGSAVQSVRSYATAELMYHERHSDKYGVLTDLIPDGVLDANLESGSKSGYIFQISVDDPTNPVHFYINGDPVEASNPLLPHYYSDDTCVIRGAVGKAADATSAPIGGD